MKYTLLSGRYETGTIEQKQSFCNLFGEENIQFKFDLYFHWFNLIHELGHYILDIYHIDMDRVDEELYVNRFAVAYWRTVDGSSNLIELEDMITKVVNQIPNPIPVDVAFEDFFKDIWTNVWDKEGLSVAMYGYFQLSCVLEALKKKQDMKEVLGEFGINIPSTDCMEQYIGDVSSDSARQVFDLCIQNLSKLGIVIDNVELVLTDNPEIQCLADEED